MAVRKLSGRHLQFMAHRALAKVVPGLASHMPVYNRVVPMVDVGTTEHWRETQTIALDAAETDFAKILPDPPPPSINRDVALIALDNVTLLGSTGAVVDERREAVLCIRGARDFVTYHDFRPVFSRAVSKPPANYINMVGSYRGHAHFFHFLFDRLPRLYYLLAHFALGKEPLVILTNEGLPDFQREIYRALQARYPNVSFQAIPENERWRLPRLYHIDDFQGIKRTLASPAVIAFQRALVFEGFGLKAVAPTRRIYVTRSDTKKRRIANEAALLPVLKRHGFESIAPGQLSLREQAALFASAQAVAGPHGAGLTNILFSPPGTRVLEIFPANKVKNTYFLLAKSLDQKYRALIGSSFRRHEWFDVEREALDKALRELLA